MRLYRRHPGHEVVANNCIMYSSFSVRLLDESPLNDIGDDLLHGLSYNVHLSILTASRTRQAQCDHCLTTIEPVSTYPQLMY
jgi:hypothetical protein